MSAIEQLIDEANPILDPRDEFSDGDVQALLTLTLDRNATLDAKELTRPVHEDDKPTNRWWIAAAAFAAVVIAVGAAVLLIPNTNDSPPATTLNQSVSTLPEAAPTTAPPPQASTTTEAVASGPVMTAEKEAFIGEYEDAFNSQDIDRFAALFAPSASRADQSTPDLPIQLDLLLSETTNLWNQESTITVDDCVATSAGVSCVVSRSGPVELGVHGSPFVMRHLFELADDGRISKILLGAANADGRADDAFQSWLRAEHPDVAEGLTPASERGLIQVFAFDDSEIYLEWAPIWADLGRPIPES